MSVVRRRGLSEVALPRSDRWLMRGFEEYYLPRYLKKHFDVLAVNRAALIDDVFATDSALVVYANHASWWDPMVALFVRKCMFPGHGFYAPIDAAALAKYPIFRRMGFYGVAGGTHRGAAEFLKRSAAIVGRSATSVWLTPEGRFCDVRNTKEPLMPGLSHLAILIETTAPQPESDKAAAHVAGQQSRCVWFVPAAIEYVFWEERLPECLCWFGKPLQATWGQISADRSTWDCLLNSGLRTAQQALASASIARDSSQFEVVLSGRTGTNSFYDIVRSLMPWLRGKRIKLQHSEKF